MVAKSPEKPYWNKINFWNDDSDISKAMADTMAAVLGGCSVTIGDKVKSLTTAIESKKDWAGAMAKLEFRGEGMSFDGFGHEGDIEYKAEAGADPWLVGQKAFSFRCGPNTIPLPGVASLLQAHTDGIVLQVINLAPFVSEGLVALKDLPSFAETATGAKLLAEESVYIPLSVGTTLFVPFGFAGIPLFAPLGSEEKGAAGLGFLWHLPLLVSKWAAAAPKEVWGAVVAWDSTHFTQMSASKLWQGRKEVFDTSVATVKERDSQ